ncbi:MAG: hypothetical protein ACOX0J_01470 [Thermoactinomyces vulgaris]
MGGNLPAAFIPHHFYGMSGQEMDREPNIPEETVKTHWFRARKEVAPVSN